MERNDEQLIERVLEGDESAFAGLVSAYLPPLYNFLFQMTQDRMTAEDLAQETFLKAWKHLSRFDRDKNFKTWLFAIGKNTAYDFFKKKKALPFSSFEDAEGNNPLENVSEDTILPDELLMREDVAAELDRVLQGIPEHYRTLLHLCYRQDFSLKEIAEILDEPYNTVKSKHTRALKALKKALLEHRASDEEKGS